MAKYNVKVDLPETMRSMMQEAQGVGEVVAVTDQHLVVQVQADDRYDLGVIVCDLQSTMVGLWSEPLAVMKPVQVSDLPARKGVTAWSVEPMEENGDEFFVLTFHHGLGRMTRLDLSAKEVADLARSLSGVKS